MVAAGSMFDTSVSLDPRERASLNHLASAAENSDNDRSASSKSHSRQMEDERDSLSITTLTGNSQVTDWTEKRSLRNIKFDPPVSQPPLAAFTI
jgi:hypothetical protein